LAIFQFDKLGAMLLLLKSILYSFWKRSFVLGGLGFFAMMGLFAISPIEGSVLSVKGVGEFALACLSWGIVMSMVVGYFVEIKRRRMLEIEIARLKGGH
jgi:hypothetical protein